MNIFDNIAHENREAMLQCINAHEKSFRKGDFVLSSDDSPMLMGILQEGSVHMVTEDMWGSQSLLCMLEPGDLMGETFACAREDNYTIEFLAVSDCRVLFMDFGRVMHTCDMMCGFHHRLIENMVKMIAAKNLELIKKIDVLSKMHMREKILTLLSQFAAAAGSETFTLPMGRVKMAEYLCVDRSSMTRELVRMADDGLIEFDRNRFTLRSME